MEPSTNLIKFVEIALRTEPGPKGRSSQEANDHSKEKGPCEKIRSDHKRNPLKDMRSLFLRGLK